VWNGWVVGIAGVWAFISPFVHLQPRGDAWSDWIVGVVAAVLGFAMMRERPAESWISGIVHPGVWWNNLIVGAILAIFGFAATRTTQQPMATSGAHAR
jgi:hypothetical protein